MDRIKELLAKKDKEGLSEVEEKELKKLQKAQEDEENTEQGDDEEKQIEEAASKMAKAIKKNLDVDGMQKSIKDLSKRLNKALKGEGTVSVKSPKLIVDKRLGELNVDELESKKIKVAGREKKEHNEVSLKTLHFLAALAENDKVKLQTLVEGTGARGGFLVPDDFANIIVEDQRDQGVMRQLAEVITTTSDTLHLPNLASRPKAAFRAEAAAKTTTTVDWGETVFTPYSLAAIVTLSDELVADAVLGVGTGIVNYVASLMSTALNEREERAFWTGNGSGTPTGIDNYTFVEVGPAAGASDSARADAFIAGVWRLGQAYRSRSAIVANSATLARMATLKDSNNNYLVTNMANGTTRTIMGRPLYEQNDLPNGRVFIGDFSYYKIVERQGITVDVSNEATVAGTSLWQNNLTGVRVEKRVDGELTLTSPIVEANNMGAGF